MVRLQACLWVMLGGWALDKLSMPASRNVLLVGPCALAHHSAEGLEDLLLTGGLPAGDGLAARQTTT